MQNFLWFSQTVQPAGDVHATARVGQNEGGRTARLKMGYFAF